MRNVVSVIVLGLVLTGCADGNDDSRSAGAPAASSSATAALRTMKDVCPTVEAALPDVDAVDGDWRGFIATVDDLASSADLEAQNALDVLGPGARAMLKLSEQGGMPLAAQMDLGDSLDAFASRCRAAGSSAFSS